MYYSVLSEMYPEGKVGVDPVCVMGLNKNRLSAPFDTSLISDMVVTQWARDSAQAANR